jgi:hypothetical protein
MIDLNELVAPGESLVRYRDVRDYLLGCSPGSIVTAEGLGLVLHERKIAKAITTDIWWQASIKGQGYGLSPNPPKLRRAHLYRLSDRVTAGKGAERKTYSRTIRAVNKATREGAVILARLVAEGFLLATGSSGPVGGNISDTGWALRGKKMLRRIDCARAETLLAKAVDAAKAFNADAGPNYYIKEMVLFGSLAGDAATVGDIDLMVLTARRYKEDRESWVKRERKRLKVIRPSGLNAMIPHTANEGAQRVQKVSPYLSVSVNDERPYLDKRGDPYRVVFQSNWPP